MAITTEHYEVTHLRARPGRSPNERWGNGQFQAYCLYDCAWEDRNTLIGEMGAEDSWAGQLYPHNTGTGARIYAANVVGWGRPSQNEDNEVLSDYTRALVTAYYSTEAPFFAGHKTFVTEYIEPARVVLPRSHYGKTWTTSGRRVKPNEMPPCEIPTFDYVVVFHKLLAIPVGAMGLLGYTNNATVGTYTMGITFPAQSLCYRDPAIVSTIRLASLSSYRVAYRLPFRYDPVTGTGAWNKAYDAERQRFDTITDSVYGVEVPHPLGNFALLAP